MARWWAGNCSATPPPHAPTPHPPTQADAARSPSTPPPRTRAARVRGKAALLLRSLLVRRPPLHHDHRQAAVAQHLQGLVQVQVRAAGAGWALRV